MQFFEIKYVCANIALGQVEEAVRTELNGPGKLLGVHHLCVPRMIVYDAIKRLDAQGLQDRRKVGIPRHERKKKIVFTREFMIKLLFPDAKNEQSDHMFGQKRSHFVLPERIRIDKGTDTGVLATIHCYLKDKVSNNEDVTKSVLHGPSTEKIERWWRELLDQLERYFKHQLKDLLESGDYDLTNKDDR
eukprot:gene1035-361_t